MEHSASGEPRVRALRLDRQLWFILSSELRCSFQAIRKAYSEYLETVAFSNLPRNVEPFKKLVEELLVDGPFATIIDSGESNPARDSEKSGVMSLLRLTNHIVECVTVSKTNIEAVTRTVGLRNRQAEWFMMVAVVG